MASHGDYFFVDVVDLYVAKARASFAETCSKEFRVDASLISDDLGKVLLALEEAQIESLKKPEVAPLDEKTKESALSLLESPDLMDLVKGAFSALGVVGEETSSLMTWLTLTSRLSDPSLQGKRGTWTFKIRP